MIAELLLQSFKKQASPAVSFDTKRCLRSRLNTNTCDLCLSLCPKKALTLRGRKIVFEAGHCSGCMACVSGCPNDAFDCGFDLLSFFPALHGNGCDEPVVLSCGKSTLAYGQPLHLPCIGLLSEPALAAMHCLATRDFYLDVRHCVDCGNGKVLDLLHTMVQGIIQKKGATDLKFHYITDNSSQKECTGNQRRFFLRMTSNSLKDFGRASTSFLNQSKNTAAGEKPEEKQTTATRRLLREAFNSLPRDAMQDKQLLLAYNHTLTANENCDCCPICTGMCPTGALKRQKDNTGKHLIFTSSRCTGCGLCAAFCRKEALVLQPGFRDDPQIALRIASVEKN